MMIKKKFICKIIIQIYFMINNKYKIKVINIKTANSKIKLFMMKKKKQFMCHK